MIRANGSLSRTRLMMVLFVVLRGAFPGIVWADEAGVRDALRHGRYSEAVEEVKRLSEAVLDNPRLAVLWAEACCEVGQYAKAKELSMAALAKNRANIAARRVLIEVAEATGDRALHRRQEDYFFDLYGAAKATSAETLTAVARAAEREDPQGAWDAYREAHRADPKYVDAYILGGRHCLNMFAWEFARQEFEQALRIDASSSEARVGLAAVSISSGQFVAGLADLAKALTENANLCEAHELMANVLAMDEQREGAFAAIKASLATNPNRVSALALLAAHYESEGKTIEQDQAISRALAVNPRAASVYTNIAVNCERRRRFPAAVAWAQKAIELDREEWRGYYIAGMNLLRLGEEREGRRLLDTSFRLNGFNIWAYNMLNTVDRDFEEKGYEYIETEHFFVKVAKNDAPFLAPYLETELDPMFVDLSDKYKIRPVGPREYEGKILILILRSHDDFSTRTVGLPDLGALGACFGQIITMPTPRHGHYGPADRFHWLAVLRHEFAHVLTLQRTDYNIPRWFTEGLSTLEENAPMIESDALLAKAFARGHLLPIAELNAGFTRPAFPEQIQLSYYQALLAVACLIAHHGSGSVQTMLDQFAARKTTEDAILQVTGEDATAFDTTLHNFIGDYLKRMQIPVRAPADDATPPEAGSPQSFLAKAERMFAAGQLAQAREAAGMALELEPKLARAHWIMGYLEFEKDPTKALEHLRQACMLAPDAPSNRLYYGLALEKVGELPSAAVEFAAAMELAPRLLGSKQNPYLRLANIHVKQGDRGKAIQVLRRLVCIDSLEHSGFAQLGKLLVDAGDCQEAASCCLQALYLDPYDFATRMVAGRAFEGAGEWDAALREFRIALHMDSGNAEALAGLGRATAALAQRGKR